MVVVAGSHWASVSLPEVERFQHSDHQYNATQFQSKMNKILLIVGESSIYDAALNDKSVDLPMILRFGPKSTVRQIKHAIASHLDDSPALDSFRISTNLHSPNPIELIGDNKTIDEFNLILQTSSTFKIFITRNKKEDQTEHRRICKNDIYLQIKITNISMPDEKKNFETILFVSETTTVQYLMSSLQDELSFYDYKQQDIVLRYGEIKITTDDANKTLKDIGLDFSECEVIILDMIERKMMNCGCRRKAFDGTDDDRIECSNSYESDNNIQSMAHPWAHTSNKQIPLASILMAPGGEYALRESPETKTKPEIVYVGLINQAMTCYLNSLLQALYMTPEFRNALYNWEYIDGLEKDAANSIPYQLQKLFLNLQTSKKNAVETTSLTKSFGWDSTEAWQQHDIQELCRVMFDALEQKFKNTQQADLINRLYEGKMIDYVKCLECGTEKSREDTFLDIPLPVKPFGSTEAYNTVEEALCAFVQPETLDGVNQYFCETCNKKCDAHKGLKFKKFPYILTLHLKRFDFDYSSFHRIKLNDRVTFPDILNVNSLLPSCTENQKSSSLEEDAGTAIKCDDSSTTDSGHLDECLPCINGIGTNEDIILNNDQDDDEGIYISNFPSTSSIHSQENERNRSNGVDCSFYKYDLFSIMIHSGSASGGHYYAYIKDFKTQEWFCFNDQNVTPITYDDIQKTYGGGSTRTFYSGAYSTSTNAYMLMYRQINYERNCLPMQVEDFPEHIQILLRQMKEQEEKKNHERALHMHKISVYCYHPVEKMLCSSRIFAVHDELLSEVVEKVYSAFDLDHIVNLDQCRLVDYNATYDIIECSHDGREDETIGSIVQVINPFYKCFKTHDMLLEIRKKDEKFEIYRSNEISTTVFVVDIERKQIINGPFIVRVPQSMSVVDYKKILNKLIHFYPQQIYVERNLVKESGNGELDESLREVGFRQGCKVFVETQLIADMIKPFRGVTPKSMLDLYECMVMLHVQMPAMSEEIMKKLNIPTWNNGLMEKETDKDVDVTKLSNSDSKNDKNDAELPAQKTEDEPIGENEEWQDQSNSEDSSLSDSDRTLVGDASENDEVLICSIADLGLQPEGEKRFNRKNDNRSLAEDILMVSEKHGDPVERLKIYIHRNISRNTLKKRLEPLIKVPVKYFKVVRQIAEINDINGAGVRTPTGSYSDGETLSIKLCRAIRDGDFTMKLYLLKLKINSLMNHEYLCEFVVFKSLSIAQIKHELIVELKKNHNIDITYEKLRLRMKNAEIPSSILFDDMTLYSFINSGQNSDDHNSGEFFIQELSHKEIVSGPNQTILFTWRYFSDSNKWDDELSEIVLNTRSTAEVKAKLSELSAIPEDQVIFRKGRWPIEHHRRSECPYQWIQLSDDKWAATFDITEIIFYRDITQDETNSMKDGLTRKYQRVPRHRFHDPSWSPRRERALKIFVDDK